MNVSVTPPVKWESIKDRRNTPNAAAIEKTVTAIVTDVWARLPESARIVLCAVCGLPPVYLYRVTKQEALNSKFRRDESNLSGRGYIHCVRMNADFKCNQQGKLSFAWTVAHELAHVYFERLWCLARQDLWRKIEKSEKLSEAENKLCTALSSRVFVDMNSPFLFLHERLADATALAWGFGAEYAEAHLLTGLDWQDLTIVRSGYLDSEIMKIHQIICEREHKKKKRRTVNVWLAKKNL